MISGGGGSPTGHNPCVGVFDNSGADPEKIFLRGGPKSKFCKMKGIRSKKINLQH